MAVGRPINLTPNIARKSISIIATAGQTLTFNVPGVGSTTLTLY